MTLGALAFLNPWLLAVLAGLPLLYWLLRTVPPRPEQARYQPTHILVGLENKEKTPARTPWWLLLIRLLATALVILALAEPILNPDRSAALKGAGPLALVIDNGWATGPRWSERLAEAERHIGEAERLGRALVVAETASAAKSRTLALVSAAEARTRLQALTPQPFAPDRTQTLEAMKPALPQAPGAGINVVWLADGIDHDGTARAFADGLLAMSQGGTLTIVEDATGHEPLGLAAGVGAEGKLTAAVLRPEGRARAGIVHAYSARGQRLGEAPFSLGAGAQRADIMFELPLEIRNQVTRVEIAAERSAGAVSLLDRRSQWQRAGLISGEKQEQSQPLLAPLYYVQKAIEPYAEIVRPKDQNIEQGIDTILKQGATVLVLADIGTVTGEMAERVDAWVRKGGVLVRFAGPRLEKGGDDLLPVALRLGGRSLGGALSWSTPQPLAAFDEASLFSGLAVPADVSVNRQVLADPARLTPEVKVWARLKDGTPLVTAAKRGEGEIVLFHITANTGWSNLPISGLFVEMLRRVSALGRLGTAGTEGDEANTAAGSASSGEPAVLAPVMTLDGFGTLRTPPPTAEPIAATKILSAEPGLAHPPGYYGAAGSPHALNVLSEKSALAGLPPMPAEATLSRAAGDNSTPLKPSLLGIALALLFADMIAVLALQGAFRGMRPARAAAVLVLAVLATAAAGPRSAEAQAAPPTAADHGFAQRATENVTLGFVTSGDAETDLRSKAGLSGLGRILALRTAVEPGEPMPVDILSDEIAFFPVLYWPVLKTASALPDSVLSKIDAFMKQGGMIIFDTQDYGGGQPAGTALGGQGGQALQRVIGRLDLPPLEPVPEDHVLTKSFYLLQSFPGRWEGGALWVEAQAETDDTAGDRKARRADGVSSILITSNDFASAWAIDETGRPLYPVIGGERQREMAFRTGVNIVMHALTGNYKADQVHVPALLERLGQ